MSKVYGDWKTSEGESFLVRLDAYQVANLRWALREINDADACRLNTGDWVNEIRWKLDDVAKENDIGPANAEMTL